MTQESILNRSVVEFVAATAAKSPTPGGGSVAGVVGALAAALGEMTLNFSKGKKKLAEHEVYHEHLGHRLAKARAMAQALVADDMAAYEVFQAAYKMPDGPEKVQQVQLATAAAINVPRELTKLALALLADMMEFAGKCAPGLITDLLASAALAEAAARLSDYNVRINLPSVADKAQAAEIKAASAADLARAVAARQEIESATRDMLP
ncbi:MAG: cyclodeaminase/cyclohydrolase family protein [Planctomycetota bacterium]